MKVGVLALQGDFEEHLLALKRMGVDASLVKDEEELKRVDALVIPGGESTTIGTLLSRYGLASKIAERARDGMPVLGTCAGMILLAKRVENWQQPLLGLMDITVRRNAFGRQKDSFETLLNIPALGEEPVRAIFIRAPLITEASPEVEILCKLDEGIVLARQGRLLACAFHPELTDDPRLYKYFLSLGG